MSTHITTPPVHPEGNPAEVLNPELLTVAFIDQSDDVREFARDAADSRLTEVLNADGNVVSKMVRNIWKGNIAREYYRQKYINEAETNIVEGQTLYANRDDVEDAARTRARRATINKFVSSYEDVIHESAGERRKDVTEAGEAGESGADLVIDTTKSIIRDYAEGRLDDVTIVEERNRLLEGLRNSSGNEQLFGEGVMIADNMIEIAQNVRRAIVHGEAIDNVMDQIRVISGESRSGARTQALYNRVDKIVEKVNSSKIGSLVNEATVATAVSVAASLARFGSTKAVNAAAMTLVPGAGAAIVAGARESKRIEDERRQHAREMATGQDYNRGNAKRRDAMQETIHASVSAQSVVEDLAINTDPERLEGADQANLQEALHSVLSAQTRIGMSDIRGIDLISYSSVAEVETERLVLDLALARAKVSLKTSLEATGEDVQRALGMDTNEEFDSNINNLCEAQQTIIEQDLAVTNKAFDALKRREIAKTAAKAALFGTSIGLVSQEVLAMVSPSRSGLVEQLWDAKNTPIDGRHHDTLLHGIFDDRDGGTELHNHEFSGKSQEHLIGEANNTELSLSEELELQQVDGKYELVDPTGKQVGSFEMTPDGSLTPESLQELRELGLVVNENTATITEQVPITRQGSLNEFILQNNEHTSRITRDLWYDNNTPAPVFDQNELDLQLGAGGSGVDAQGNYIFSAQSLTADGSFHGSESAAWEQLASEGKLKMAFSASGDTQTQVFTVSFDAAGNAVIPKDSPTASLFSVQDGRAVFEGKYAELVQSMGVDESGTEHVRMLATHVGEDNAINRPFNITEITTKTTTKPAYEILGSSYDTSSELSSFVEMAPVIPIYSRKPLENLLVNELNPFPYYHGELDPADIERRRARMSPRLQENPDAQLSEQEEIEWYFSQQTPEYNERVRQNVSSIPEPMGESVETVITIPVAGHQESDNIYRTLEAYTNQTTDNDKFEILLYVNHPITDQEGNRLNADATLAEIERFKLDNPDMPVRVMYEPLPRDEARISYIRKVLVGAALMRHMDRGIDKPLVIISNDADTIAVNEHYVRKMTETTLEDDIDATIGQLDWDAAANVNYPEVHIGTRLFQMVDISRRVRDDELGATPGANTAVRASTYAAVGGHNTDVEGAGEDVELGRDIQAARAGTDRPVIGFGGVVGSRIETSARRAVHTWLRLNDAPYNQWNHGFSAGDDDVRSINIETLTPADFQDPTRRAELVANVEHLVNKTLESMNPEGSISSVKTGSVTISDDDKERLTRHIERALHFMGIEFVWAGKKIKITDGTRMVDALEWYAQRAVSKDLEKKSKQFGGVALNSSGQNQNV